MSSAALSRRALLALGAGGVLALGRPAFAQGPERLVVAGGDLTEIAFALGAGERIVAVDTTSMFPAETGPLPKIGYLRQLTPEGILALAPDAVIASADAGPPPTLERLAAAGVRVEVAPEGKDTSVIPAKIAFMGRALDREAEAEALAEAFRAQMGALQAALAGVETRPAVMVLLAAGRGAPLVAGTGTAADEIVGLARGLNAVTGYEGYRPLSAEAAIAAAPDVLLVPDHAIGMMGGREALLARPEIAATPAGAAGRLVVMDGLKLLGLGLRTPLAIAELARALHPQARIEVAGMETPG
ncbi:heme/hemin ABC transporter substrate-binding protein [Albimonas pacifica]|uniref:Iron complex transport system substrate-binding protein n=1 Tax=Albimonas pacifica TaxID=1114924 RepID=A0A1I3BVY6_9RHOB|nr:ABC transporter substrate-binding protein [Albimonas pacifica]SFH66494.1 iron complex transport system substrate-binding protein [Albimonas pacifica]